jgi:putative flavoprotein involved in K+ transport
MPREVETLIIGAGQAGLSVGRYLKEEGRQFLILEKSANLGSSWQNRYDSLILDSFAKYSHLDGFPFPGDQMRQPKKDEVVEYLSSFAKKFGLQPQFSTEVFKIEKTKDKFTVHTDKGVYESRCVVLATGPFQKPFIPERAQNVLQNISQIHSSDYKNASQLQNGITLVVGGGNSGAEIAKEIAESGRKVFFSFKGKFKSVHSSHFSQWLAYRLGLAHLPKNSWLGKIIIWYTKGKAVGINVKKLLSHPNITCIGSFDTSKTKNVANIIWATGYESDFSTVSIPSFDPSKQKRGITNIPGLYILNIRWQYSKSSSHLAGVSRDAKYIAKDIMKS